jgi:hypothetical protein
LLGFGGGGALEGREAGRVLAAMRTWFCPVSIVRWWLVGISWAGYLRMRAAILVSRNFFGRGGAIRPVAPIKRVTLIPWTPVASVAG